MPMIELEPHRGPPGTLADRLRDYVMPYDPSLVENWHGSDDATLREYAMLAGFEDLEAVPASYRSYARAMGADDGGLFKDFKIDARLGEVVELYRDCLRTEPESLDPNLPVCGSFVIGDQISFDRRSVVDDPAVVETSDGEWFANLSLSWEALVMQAAILRVESRRLSHARWLSCTPTGLKQAIGEHCTPKCIARVVDGFGVQHGLSQAWPSDVRHRVLLSDARSLYGCIGAGGSLLLYAFAEEEVFLRAVENELARKLGAAKTGIAQIVDGALGDVRR